jgi:hypothetical protein
MEAYGFAWELLKMAVLYRHLVQTAVSIRC